MEASIQHGKYYYVLVIINKEFLMFGTFNVSLVVETHLLMFLMVQCTYIMRYFIYFKGHCCLLLVMMVYTCDGFGFIKISVPTYTI